MPPCLYSLSRGPSSRFRSSTANWPKQGGQLSPYVAFSPIAKAAAASARRPSATRNKNIVGTGNLAPPRLRYAGQTSLQQMRSLKPPNYSVRQAAIPIPVDSIRSAQYGPKRRSTCSQRSEPMRRASDLAGCSGDNIGCVCTSSSRTSVARPDPDCDN
jgi:hypothetical protein